MDLGTWGKDNFQKYNNDHINYEIDPKQFSKLIKYTYEGYKKEGHLQNQNELGEKYQFPKNTYTDCAKGETQHTHGTYEKYCKRIQISYNNLQNLLKNFDLLKDYEKAFSGTTKETLQTLAEEKKQDLLDCLNYAKKLKKIKKA